MPLLGAGAWLWPPFRVCARSLDHRRSEAFHLLACVVAVSKGPRVVKTWGLRTPNQAISILIFRESILLASLGPASSPEIQIKEHLGISSSCGCL